IPNASISGGYKNGCAGYFSGGKVYFYSTGSSANKYKDHSLQVLDLTSLTAAYVSNGLYWDGQVDYDIIHPDSSMICKYLSSIWYPVYMESNSGVFSTVLNADSFLSLGLFVEPVGGQMLCVPPSACNTNNYLYTLFRSAIPALNGQWGRNWYADSTVTTPFAYTRYQVPADAPVRPEGSGMTVTYELDISI
ncbi:MAG: hypothetical protein Q4P84_05410, partial [Elusimicrobiales bacterium]|nr:hypothetical protein [Elusimicrobiales bacterium]